MNNFFKHRRERLLQLKAKREKIASLSVKHQNTIVCKNCGASMTVKQQIDAYMTCPTCNFHFPIGAYHRLSLLLDTQSFEELQPQLIGGNPLEFPEYSQKLKMLREKTGIKDAIIVAKGKINKHSVIVAVLDSRFLMGSMGAVMGEKVAYAAEKARKLKLPLIIFTASGGARMQEGIISLMQMAKTSAAIQKFSDAGGLYISYLTHPTTGGVTASFASLGDITLAEPEALIGFAGPRVIEQTIGQSLPEGFQKSEFLQEHGYVDKIVPRTEMKKVLTQILSLHKKKRRI